MITISLYTHQSCSDLWPMFKGQVEKHCQGIPIHWTYGDDSKSFSVQYCEELDKIATPYVIWMQEDHILYDDAKLDEALCFLDCAGYADYIRLLRSGTSCREQVGPNIWQCSGFCMQPTIWRKDRLREVLAKSGITSIREEAKVKGGFGAFYYAGEPKRGYSHFDSSIFPCVCTAINKGKWNMAEYGDILRPLCERYGIDPNIRGER